MVPDEEARAIFREPDDLDVAALGVDARKLFQGEVLRIRLTRAPRTSR